MAEASSSAAQEQNERCHWMQFRDRKIEELRRGGLRLSTARKFARAEIRERLKLQAIAGIGVATMARFDVQVEEGRLKARFVISPEGLPEKERSSLAQSMWLAGARYT
jgi:hypothetical protein